VDRIGNSYQLFFLESGFMQKREPVTAPIEDKSNAATASGDTSFSSAEALAKSANGCGKISGSSGGGGGGASGNGLGTPCLTPIS
jgi:uncharacterized membrane protein